MASTRTPSKRAGVLAAAVIALPLTARAELPDAAVFAPRTEGESNEDVLRIPLPVPVPQLARRPGAPPPDPIEMQAWREARAELLARVRMAMLPPPPSAPGVMMDAPLLPPVTPPAPRLAERPPGFILPFENGRVTSMFNRGRVHPAIDLAGRLGTPVFATSHAQTVTFAGGYGGYGNAVITKDRQGRVHLYGHLQAVHARVGATLAQGERLGLLGSTGYSTGPHVHYEVKDAAGRHIDPATLLFPGRAVSAGFTWSDPRLRNALAARD